MLRESGHKHDPLLFEKFLGLIEKSEFRVA